MLSKSFAPRYPSREGAVPAGQKLHVVFDPSCPQAPHLTCQQILLAPLLKYLNRSDGYSPPPWHPATILA